MDKKLARNPWNNNLIKIIINFFNLSQMKPILLKKWLLIPVEILLISFLVTIFVRSPTFTIIGVLFLSIGFLFFRTGKFSLRQIVVFLLLIPVLSPVSLYAGIPSIRIELIIILVAWLLLLSGYLPTGKGVISRWSSTNKWFFLFAMSTFVSVVYAELVASLNISPEDLQKYYFISLGVLSCSALISFAQYWHLLSINSIIYTYYPPTKIEGYLRSSQVVGTIGNSNEFGALMVLANSLVLNRIKELPYLIENKILNNRESLEKLSKNAIINSQKFSLQRVTNYFREYLLKKML